MRREWVSDIVIEEILRNFPEQIQERRRRLADAEWCSRHPQAVDMMHDPERARELAYALAEQSNPFSASNLERHAADLEWCMLNTSDPSVGIGVAQLN